MHDLAGAGHLPAQSFHSISATLARFCLALGLLLFLSTAIWALPARQETTSVVYVLTFEGPITPVLEQYLGGAIDRAQREDAEAIILQLDTPGGSVEVTQSIIQLMLASQVPVIVYVAPSGAHAGSAGTFVTLAANAAAMAPGTSIGAASPVGPSGEDVGETLEAKLKNILSADIENLAKRRGDAAAKWAVAAVQNAQAATAQQALQLGVIDFVASDIADLLNQLDGFSVTVAGQPRTLHTATAIPEEIEMDLIERFLNFISDASIASILLSLGVAGLIFEFRSPGLSFPGIAGVICLLLAFYGLGQLDANYAGLALIAVAFVLLVAEAFAPSFGLLAVSGGIAFVLGVSLLFNAPGISVPWPTIIAITVLLVLFVIFIGRKTWAAQRRPALTGGEAIIGQVGTVKEPFQAGEAGSIYVFGEWWNARLLDGSLAKGDKAEVVDRKGYTLIVRPVP